MNRYSRQLDLVDSKTTVLPIHIIGAGGVGSWATLLLAKMGFRNIIVYDNDFVEDHNVASQFFSEDQIGMKKVKALNKSVLAQTGLSIVPIDIIEKEEFISDGIIILAVDSMEERIRLGNIYKSLDTIIIDSRMSGLSYSVHQRKTKDYLSTTVDPKDVEPGLCTAKAISFNCASIGATVANLVRLYVKNGHEDWDINYCFNTNSCFTVNKNAQQKKACVQPVDNSVVLEQQKVTKEE